MKVAILGGGISGLACAYELQKIAQNKKLPLQLTLFETSSRLGGSIQTLKRDNILMECGPDSISLEEDHVQSIIKELNLDGEIIHTNPDKRKSFIYIGKEFIPMSEGLKLMALKEILPFLWNIKNPEDFKEVQYSQFVSFRNGIESLVEGFYRKISSDIIKLNHPVKQIRKTKNGYQIVGESFEDETEILCLCLPAKTSSVICKDFDPELSQAFSQIPVRACQTVNFVYPAQAVGRLPSGFGFIVPQSEGKKISGATFSNNKYPGRHKSGTELIRVFLSGGNMTLDSKTGRDEIVATARKEIEAILSIHGEPLDLHLSVYEESLADYKEGHEVKAQAVLKEASKHQGLFVAGNWMNGAGIPRCLQNGQRAAEDIYRGILNLI